MGANRRHQLLSARAWGQPRRLVSHSSYRWHFFFRLGIVALVAVPFLVEVLVGSRPFSLTWFFTAPLMGSAATRAITPGNHKRSTVQCPKKRSVCALCAFKTRSTVSFCSSLPSVWTVINRS